MNPSIRVPARRVFLQSPRRTFRAAISRLQKVNGRTEKGISVLEKVKSGMEKGFSALEKVNGKREKGISKAEKGLFHGEWGFSQGKWSRSEGGMPNFETVGASSRPAPGYLEPRFLQREAVGQAQNTEAVANNLIPLGIGG
jgi:hypothetical protein